MASRVQRKRAAGTFAMVVLGAALLLCGSAERVAAQTTPEPPSDVNNEYRLTAYPSYRITDKLAGLTYVGLVFKPEGSAESVKSGGTGYTAYYLASGTIYSPVKSVQLWSGLIGALTDYSGRNNVMEWRPFVGVKVLGSNAKKWRYYNFTRYELRLFDTLNSQDFKKVHRLRNQVRIEIPLASAERANKPKTTYLLAEVEPIYRSDTSRIDPLRVRTGLGIILTPRVIMELQYYGQFTRPNDRLQYTDNIWRVNFKISTKKGLFNLWNMDLDD